MSHIVIRSSLILRNWHSSRKLAEENCVWCLSYFWTQFPLLYLTHNYALQVHDSTTHPNIYLLLVTFGNFSFDISSWLCLRRIYVKYKNYIIWHLRTPFYRLVALLQINQMARYIRNCLDWMKWSEESSLLDYLLYYSPKSEPRVCRQNLLAGVAALHVSL